MPEHCLILCTSPNQEIARIIAAKALEKKLAACINLIPGLESWYVWQGQVQQDAEVQMLFKTQKNLADALYKLVLSLHPYDVPEWLVLDIAGGGQDYLNWITSCTK
ncbi:divalent-cation tolerance protein CutA [Aliiglaciecola sp. CAU 1673]|uniref:divalent-cation tolerance protein CutA n=1 Tax=Aliiglaciecola sp. CAU 1673 TaxID=3032595 RepID=UPI0023DC39F0|nr:divalent-cation tolerance protein CutA [Aliiglaciecola sp. CAU 1673]MDF2177890.1 divalent-cation tolerance protein CutA [Aliiglaciecola sp. CAU 1673]